MQWADEGIVLSTKAHGESSAIVELFTRFYGRHLGLVRGGQSRRMRPTLQPGNFVSAKWRARLAEHLGAYSVEILESNAASVMDDRAALAGLNTLTTLSRLLPERDPHPGLYEGTKLVVRALSRESHWPALLVRWEMALLDDLGFGLDLQSCASTGQTSDLIYVSPKSGRAVSREAGRPYSARLLPLPEFLRLEAGEPVTAPPQDIADGLRLTSYFFKRHVWGPRGIKPPQARAQLERLLRD